MSVTEAELRGVAEKGPGAPKGAGRDRRSGFELYLFVAALVLCALPFMPFVQMDEKYKYAPTIFYGVCLFALISNALMAGLADRLTKWRGEKWVKEIEYVYLTLGSLGLFGSINRMDKMVDRLAPEYDLLGPLVLMSAIVLDTSRLAQKLASGTS